MPGLEDLYREIILDHYRSPRNRGELESPPAVRVEGFNPLCGDEIVVTLDVEDGVVADIKIGGTGCSISQSSAPAAPAGSVASWIDIMPLKVAIRSRTSATGFPFTAADINDADDWLMEQPVPAILMSDSTPSSTSMVTTISSPQSGLNPSTRTAGGDSSSPRFRGER